VNTGGELMYVYMHICVCICNTHAQDHCLDAVLRGEVPKGGRAGREYRWGAAVCMYACICIYTCAGQLSRLSESRGSAR